MRRWLGILCVGGLAGLGCEKPEMIPMTPPGISPMRTMANEEAAEAVGEQNSRGVVPTPGEDKSGARPVPTNDPTAVRPQVSPGPMPPGRP